MHIWGGQPEACVDQTVRVHIQREETWLPQWLKALGALPGDPGSFPAPKDKTTKRQQKEDTGPQRAAHSLEDAKPSGTLPTTLIK